MAWMMGDPAISLAVSADLSTLHTQLTIRNLSCKQCYSLIVAMSLQNCGYHTVACSVRVQIQQNMCIDSMRTYQVVHTVVENESALVLLLKR